MRLETIAVHAGQAPDPVTGAVAPPIQLSTTFERDPQGELRGPYIYARDGNPTRAALEQAMAALEGGEAALAFSSGQAATTTVLQALRPGDHVIIPDFVYYGTPKLVHEIFVPWGLQATAVDMRDPGEVAAAMRAETKLVWIETPSNPLLTITDIAAVCGIARRGGARVAVDNTWATPVGQRPFDLGADLVMHASTKYLGGHSDVTGGLLVTRIADDFYARLRMIQQTAGAIAAPFDSWLVLRGLKTLAWRVRAHTQNAAAVAQFLESHERVEAVHYPGLASHPSHDVVRRQMLYGGGMLSFQVRGARREALAVAGRLTLFTRATSLGGAETLIEHRASVEGPASRSPENLLRVSIGLEHADDLVEDLGQALA